jgi:hypothetical protein
MKKITDNTVKATKVNSIPRRDFIKKLGGGIFFFFIPWPAIDFAQAQQARRTLTKDYNAFLQIAGDGMVNCFTGKIEMGQGIITSLPQMMADELNVPLEKVKSFWEILISVLMMPGHGDRRQPRLSDRQCALQLQRLGEFWSKWLLRNLAFLLHSSKYAMEL